MWRGIDFGGIVVSVRNVSVFFLLESGYKYRRIAFSRDRHSLVLG